WRVHLILSIKVTLASAVKLPLLPLAVATIAAPVSGVKVRVTPVMLFNCAEAIHEHIKNTLNRK
ncbi:MAG: hypothetical protein AAFO82_14780, partial [Bacteroidota bacterium]